MASTYSSADLMKFAVEERLRCNQFPRVGAVVAKEGRLLATGFRGEVGKVHAERVALEKLTPSDRQGSTVYTTLEPCVHLQDEQIISSCTDLIIESGIETVVIGVLDPNGTIYSQGYRKLQENNVRVSFFNRKLRDAVEEETFEYGDVHRIVSSGKRRVPVVGSGVEITIQFGPKDERTIPIRWSSLQSAHGCVDLISSKGAVKIAAGARTFGDITAPDVFRFPSHFARMSKGMLAVVKPRGATFCVIIKLLEIFEKDILFQWEVRNS